MSYIHPSDEDFSVDITVIKLAAQVTLQSQTWKRFGLLLRFIKVSLDGATDTKFYNYLVKCLPQYSTQCNRKDHQDMVRGSCADQCGSQLAPVTLGTASMFCFRNPKIVCPPKSLAHKINRRDISLVLSHEFCTFTM